MLSKNNERKIKIIPTKKKQRQEKEKTKENKSLKTKQKLVHLFFWLTPASYANLIQENGWFDSLKMITDKG